MGLGNGLESQTPGLGLESCPVALGLDQGRHLREAGGAVAPPPLKEKEKRKKERKKRKKREKKEKKKERKKGTMNNVKLLHMKCCFSNFSIVRWH